MGSKGQIAVKPYYCLQGRIATKGDEGDVFPGRRASVADLHSKDII